MMLVEAGLQGGPPRPSRNQPGIEGEVKLLTTADRREHQGDGGQASQWPPRREASAVVDELYEVARDATNVRGPRPGSCRSWGRGRP